jgi:hypothetical protein
MNNNIKKLKEVVKTNEQTSAKFQELIKRSSLLITVSTTILIS